VFTSGATESNNHAIASVLFGNTNPVKKTILISAIEHKCVKNAAYFYANKLSYTVKEIPVKRSGLVDLDAYKTMLDEDVVMVCVMAVNNEIGVIQDIKTLANLAHEVGAKFHCDAAQAPEAIDIDVKGWEVDTMSLSGHKIYGPKGIGVLYIRNILQAQLPPLIHGGGQQGGTRSGTLPTDLCLGMAKALDLTVRNAAIRRARLNELKNQFVTGLKKAGIKFELNGEQNRCHPGNINVQFKYDNAPELLNALQPDIAASSGSACNSDMILPSHVLKAIGLSDEESISSIRFSLGRNTNEEQISSALKIIIERLQKQK
jgi:cysteine desulfurase